MNTCLYSIFSSIYSSLSKKHNKSHIKFIAERITASCTLVPINERHFNMFLEALILFSEDKSESSQKLYAAYKEANNCSLCVSCVGCAKSFYKQIVTILFSPVELNGSFNYWSSVIKLSSTSNEINFNNVENYLLRHIEDKPTALEFYQRKYEHIRNIESLSNRFINLKGLSSSTPTLFNSTFNSDFSGGGLYFNWNNLGIAVDPGYNFVSNMHKYGIFIHDIDIVIVTHEHIDHTCDIRTIDDLNYQLNSLSNNTTPHIIHWYWDSETDKIYHYPLENKYNVIHIIDNINENPFENAPILLDANISLRPVQTKHIMVDDTPTYKKHTFGFVLELKSDKQEVKIGYTSDTSYFEELSKIFNSTFVSVPYAASSKLISNTLL